MNYPFGIEKSTREIEEVYRQYYSESSFLSDVLDLLRLEDTRPGASWLLKRHLGSGNQLSEEQQSQFMESIEYSSEWEVNLHFLQTLNELDFRDQDKIVLVTYIEECIEDSNKFVRAWGYSCFIRLARYFIEFEKEAQMRIASAMESESASVKARIRQALKQ